MEDILQIPYRHYGKIISIKRKVDQDCELIQGVRPCEAYKYQGPMYKGGNGTYLHIGAYHGVKDIMHFEFDHPELNPILMNGKHYAITDDAFVDIRPCILDITRCQRISPQLMKEIQTLQGGKYHFHFIPINISTYLADGTPVANCLCMTDAKVRGQYMRFNYEFELTLLD